MITSILIIGLVIWVVCSIANVAICVRHGGVHFLAYTLAILLGPLGSILILDTLVD